MSENLCKNIGLKNKTNETTMKKRANKNANQTRDQLGNNDFGKIDANNVGKMM